MMNKDWCQSEKIKMSLSIKCRLCFLPRKFISAPPQANTEAAMLENNLNTRRLIILMLCALHWRHNQANLKVVFDFYKI